MGKHKLGKHKKEKKVKKDKKEKKSKRNKESKKSSRKEKDKLPKSHNSSSNRIKEDISIKQAATVLNSSSSKNRNLISDDDYFLKSEHFRVWCVLIRKKSFESLTSDEAHKLFIDEFAKQYNQNELPEMFYKDEIPVEMREAALKTKHKWQFKVSKDEEEKISLVADDVDFKTRHVTEGVWNHMHQPSSGSDVKSNSNFKSNSVNNKSSSSSSNGVTVSSSSINHSNRKSDADTNDHNTNSSSVRKYADERGHDDDHNYSKDRSSNSTTSSNNNNNNSSSGRYDRDRTSNNSGDSSEYNSFSRRTTDDDRRLQQDNDRDEIKRRKTQDTKQYRDYSDNILDQLPNHTDSHRGSDASGGGRLLAQEKQKAKTSSFHAAAREREEDQDGLNMSETMTMGGGGNDETSYEATKARLNKNKDYRSNVKNERINELMRKEEVKNAHFMSQLLGVGVDLSKGPIKIAPRDH